MKKRTYIYKSFERFWHWSQALLILFLAITGFEIHSSYHLFGFRYAVKMHNFAAWAFLVLIIFAIFWHFVTGEWKQYIPTTKFIKEQIDYYITGIFRNAPHPTKKTVYNKFNPLQRLIYLGLKILVIPVQVITGFAYLYYMYPDSIGQTLGLNYIAVIHTLGAFVLLAFVIAHVYLTTTGNTPTESLYAMLTGWEVIDIDENELRKEQLVKAVNNSVAGYYRINKEGIIVDVNKAWLDLYKCNDKSKYVGKHYSVTREKENLEQLEKLINDVFNGKYIHGVFTKRKCSDGSTGQHILSMNPIFDKDKIIEAEGFIIDVEHAENESNYLPYLIKNSTAAYYKLDINGYILEVNNAWLNLYKYKSESEVKGKHFSLFRPDESIKDFQNIFSKLINGEAVSSAKIARLCKDGSVGYQLVSANPIYQDAKIVGMEGFILPIE